jgi:Mg2+/Co2+ transporter CorC
MSGWAIAGAFVLLPVAVCLEEAVGWFGRHASDLHEREEGAEGAGAFLADACRSHLMSRFLVAVSFALLAGLVVTGSTSLWTRFGLLAWGLAWTLGAGALAGLRWQSPLSLAGRGLYRPLRALGTVLRGLLVVWGRGWFRQAGLLGWVREGRNEMEWLWGRTGEDEQVKMLATLQEFGESLVEDVMVPREELVGIAADVPVSQVLELVKTERYSRYPVYEDSLDSVVGVLHVFDLLTASSEATAGSLARKPLFTNATKPVGTLLRELQVTYNQMAVVVDEYGGTAGIVTVEDLLEELVGEIEDEDDEPVPQVRRLKPGAYWVDGTMRVDELNEALELSLEEGEYDTLAGLVLDRLERVPKAGERLRENGVWLEVLAAEPHRIHALRVVVDPREEAE